MKSAEQPALCDIREFAFLVSKSTAADSSSRPHTRIYRTTRAVVAPADATQERIAPATHYTSPPQQAGRACLVLCVCVFERTRLVVLKMLIQAPGNLLCFAVELGFFLRDHPTPFTTTVSTGPATVEYKQHRTSTVYVAPTPLTWVVLSCVCGV